MEGIKSYCAMRKQQDPAPGSRLEIFQDQELGPDQQLQVKGGNDGGGDPEPPLGHEDVVDL
jgi:hypothetical protein